MGTVYNTMEAVGTYLGCAGVRVAEPVVPDELPQTAEIAENLQWDPIWQKRDLNIATGRSIVLGTVGASNK